MIHSHTDIWTHLVISAKNYQPLFTEEWKAALQPCLEDLHQDIPEKHGTFCILPDHIHFLIKLPDDIALSTLVNQIKQKIKDHLNQEFDDASEFAWEDSYHAHSVSLNSLSTEKSMIERQEIKHKEITLEEELKFFGM